MKDKLLKAAIIRKDIVTIDDAHVVVREIGAHEFAKYGKLSAGDKDADGTVKVPPDPLKATAYLIQCCVIDDEGNPILSDEEAENIALAARVAMPIVNKVMKLSGFGEDKEEKHALAG